MEVLMYLVRYTLLLIINVLEVAMLLRAIFSWFDPEQGSRLSAFLYLVTEPIIMPIRALCVKKNWFQGTPLDIPFLIAVILLALLQTVLRVL